MPRSKRLKLQEYVVELVEAGAAVLMRDTDATPDSARALMLEVAEAVCQRNAKSTVYIPEAAGLTKLKRNTQIWIDYQTDNPEPPFTRRFTPARAQELAAKHDLSSQQIYNILRGLREQELAELQDELPGLEPAA